VVVVVVVDVLLGVSTAATPFSTTARHRPP